MIDDDVAFEMTSFRTAKRRQCVWLLYGVTAFWGIAQVVASESGAIYMITAFLLACAATFWAVLDGRIIERRLPAVASLVYFFLWPAASLAYLIWTRGWRGFRLWLLHLVGLFGTQLLTFYPTLILAYSFGLIDAPSDGTLQPGE